MTVTDYANAFETSEHEVFCRAWRHWYGRDDETSGVERDFGRYLALPEQLPCYVRSFLAHYYVLAA